MWVTRQDLLYCYRSARRAPLLSIAAVAALAVGIGVNAGVFRLLNSMFLEPPTSQDPSSYVQAYPSYEGWLPGANQQSAFTTEDYQAIRSRSRTLSEVAAWSTSDAVLGHDRGTTPAMLVSCNYFHVLGTDNPIRGRLFNASECAPGNTTPVAVLSEAVWKSRFNSDPSIAGKTIHLNGIPFVVAGVAPSDNNVLAAGGIYMPYTAQPIIEHGQNYLASPDAPWLSISGRLRKGESRADARTELTAIMHAQDRAYLQRKVSTFNRRTSIVLTNGSFIEIPALRDRVAILLSLILGPLSLVLLLACTNVAMLFLSRAVARRGEIAVRLALGAGKDRLIRMLVLESLLTAAIAGLIALAFAYRVPQWIMRVASPDMAATVTAHPDWRVFGYLAVLALVATVVSSLAPARAAWRLDLVSALRGREGSATARSRIMSIMIVTQIAMSFVLVAAAVLFARLPGRITAMDSGFEMRHIVYVPLSIDTSPQNRTAALALSRAVTSRILAIPGVESIAYQSLGLFRELPPSEIRMPGQEKGQGKPATVDNVSADFFSTFGIRLMSGRPFRASDFSSAGADSVAVISAAFARQYLPGANPLGRVIITPEGKRLIVVGVASDLRSERFGLPDGPRVYTLRDPDAVDGQLYVRFAGNASSIESAIQNAVRAVDPTQLETPQTIWESLEGNARQMRSLAGIIVVMAGIAVALAVVGLYGVLSFLINLRRREFGIRMALGADRVAVFRSVMLRGARQIALGLACGLALAEPAAWVFSRVTAKSPLPIQAFDAPVYGIAAALLVIISLLAMFLPALRATRVDPVDALRTE